MGRKEGQGAGILMIESESIARTPVQKVPLLESLVRTRTSAQKLPLLDSTTNHQQILNLEPLLQTHKFYLHSFLNNFILYCPAAPRLYFQVQLHFRTEVNRLISYI
jgi:hypothetical protein